MSARQKSSKSRASDAEEDGRGSEEESIDKSKAATTGPLKGLKLVAPAGCHLLLPRRLLSSPLRPRRLSDPYLHSANKYL